MRLRCSKASVRPSRFPTKPSPIRRQPVGGRLPIRATRVRRLRAHRAVMGATLVVGVVLIAGVVNLSVRKHVNLVVDGRQETVATTSDSVQDLLLEEGITLTSAILVQPSPTSAIADGMTVVVHPPHTASGAEAFLASGAALFESSTDV